MKSDDKTVNLEVAEVLRRLRNRTDMKAEDVGKLIGRSKQTISAWETGKASPDASLFLKLCEIYGVKDINKEFENIKKIAFAQKRAKANKKELVKLLSDFLVNSGYIEDGNDLTDDQGVRSSNLRWITNNKPLQALIYMACGVYSYLKLF